MGSESRVHKSLHCRPALHWLPGVSGCSSGVTSGELANLQHQLQVGRNICRPFVISHAAWVTYNLLPHRFSIPMASPRTQDHSLVHKMDRILKFNL
ncbi:hypothetical protein XELAEV_18039390mg [Xenopus laevis]|uniref:Uncharacterized protein n=1 Tax=Xenopus laevis TaxID=8355 RepID=A0A974C7R0_XENLA|nr:hypothetical protein XELAEV_18039390mg [Xenopus laevis]